MKKTLLLLTCLLITQAGWAQELPKWANKARKAVFSASRTIRGIRFSIPETDSTLMKTVRPYPTIPCLKGPERAVVVTADGKELPVEYIPWEPTICTT